MRTVNAATGQVLSIRRVVGPPTRELWHFAGNKRRCLLIAWKDGEMFMTRSFNVTPNTTEQHLTARSDKSVAYVTNNKRLFDVLYYWSWQTRSIARPLSDSRATCYTSVGVMFMWTRHFGNEWTNFDVNWCYLAQVVHGTRTWNDQLWGQEVKWLTMISIRFCILLYVLC